MVMVPIKGQIHPDFLHALLPCDVCTIAASVPEAGNVLRSVQATSADAAPGEALRVQVLSLPDQLLTNRLVAQTAAQPGGCTHVCGCSFDPQFGPVSVREPMTPILPELNRRTLTQCDVLHRSADTRYGVLGLMPCHAEPCCAMLCCAMLCCAMLCCAMLCCAMLCCAGVLTVWLDILAPDASSTNFVCLDLPPDMDQLTYRDIRRWGRGQAADRR
jgi:hypothetical protein